jgi:sugar lactone lactonase YvrE
VVEIPAPHVTTVGFGGEDYATLYITTARDGLSPDALELWPQSGDLFSLKPGVHGVPEPLFPLK